MRVIRGDIVSVVLSRDYGKPRPAVIVQSNHFADMASVIVAPLTSATEGMPLFRVTVKPAEENGLKSPSSIMIDKLSAIPKARIGTRIGQIDSSTMLEVNRRMAVFLGIG